LRSDMTGLGIPNCEVLVVDCLGIVLVLTSRQSLSAAYRKGIH
jgi:hypothetical protein